MKLQLYYEDTLGKKHIFYREIDDELIFDELDELLTTFNMLLASSGYTEYVTLNSNEEMED